MGTFKWFSWIRFLYYDKQLLSLKSEPIFLDILQKIDNYYSQHENAVENERLQMYKGPQNFEDSLDMERLHYCGIGKYKFYRLNTLHDLIEREYGHNALAQFKCNPLSEEYITNADFDNLVYKVNKHISTVNKRHLHRYVPFSGPQSHIDRGNPEKMNYNVLYKSKKASVADVPAQNNNDIPAQKNNEIPSTSPNDAQDSSSDIVSQAQDPSVGYLRRCIKCKKYRLVDQRSATKYALGYYDYNSVQNIRIQFSCDRMMDINCSAPSDIQFENNIDNLSDMWLALLSPDDESDTVGLLLKTENAAQCPGSNIANVSVVMRFGYTLDKFSSNFDTEKITAAKIDNNRVILGALPTKRFRPLTKSNRIFPYKFLIKTPRQSKVCTHWHDDAIIDSEDPNQQLTARYLTAVRNMHCMSNNLKRLRCVKCNCETVGLEDSENITLEGDGDVFQLEDANLSNALLHSQVLNQCVNLDPRFKETDAYKSTATYAEGVCTACQKHYDIINNKVTPKLDEHGRIMESELNIWGAENLMSLDVFDDQEYKTFVKTLTRAECLVISPLHVCITILRHRVNKVPWSIGGSIVFARVGHGVLAKNLPWTDFGELPFVVVVHRKNEKSIVEATIDMNKLCKARYYMEKMKRCPVYGEMRTQYRYCSECPFSNEKMDRLKNEQLCGKDIGVPKDLRKVTFNQLKHRESAPLQLPEFSNWLNSGTEYGSSVKEWYSISLLEKGSANNEMHISNHLWRDLLTFAKDRQEPDSSFAPDININTIVEFCFYKKYFNQATDAQFQNPVEGNLPDGQTLDFAYLISEEFQMLATEFSNDSAGGLGQCANLHVPDQNPDRIMQEAVEKTALKRVEIPPYDRNNPIDENMVGYLPKCFPQLFLSGDADPHQRKPARLDSKPTVYLKNYLSWLSKQPEVSQIPEMIFLIYNKNKRLESRKIGFLAFKNLQAKSDIPTLAELQNNHELADKIGKDLMHCNAGIIDGEGFWIRHRNAVLGNQRDLEDVPEWRAHRNFPIYAKDFQTRATPYQHGPGIHRLMPGSDQFQTLDNEDKDKAQQFFQERMKNILQYPQIVCVWSSLFAEIDSTYFTKLRYDASSFSTRAEWGSGNANPHHHKITYSEKLSKYVHDETEKLQQLLKELCSQALGEGNDLTEEKVQQEITNAVMLAWNDLRTRYINKMAQYSSNWNPGLTADGKKKTYDYETDRKNLTSTLDMASIIHKAMKSGDFDVLDDIYVRVLNTSCRHTMHSGSNGRPTKKDYCSSMKRKLDKKAMRIHTEKTGETCKIHKQECVCKRRFPREMRDKPEIFQDPHNKKVMQLGLPCNDIWLNGGDPFANVLWLHNVDDKCIVMPQFCKNPKIDWTLNNPETEHLPSLILYRQTSNLGADYIIKYAFKQPVAPKLPSQLLLEAMQSLNPNETVSATTGIKMQNSIALRTHTSVYNAVHRNLNLPFVITNMESQSVNATGFTMFRQDYQPADGDDYTFSTFDRFDKRHGNENMVLKGVHQDQFQKTMCLHQFFDEFKVREPRPPKKTYCNTRNKNNNNEKDKNDDNKKRLYEISKRKLFAKGKLQLTRGTPHFNKTHANPKSINYWRYCKAMVFLRKPIHKTSDVMPDSQLDDEAKQKYWIDFFYETFPNGVGLPCFAQRYFEHYHPETKNVTFSSSESSEESSLEDEPVKKTQGPATNSHNENDGIPLAKNAKERFYQDKVDQIRNPTEICGTDVAENENRINMDRLVNPQAHDVHSWLKGNTVTAATIGKGLDEIRKIRVASSSFRGGVLIKKQKLVRDIIVDYVKEYFKHEKDETSELPKPLRLFVMGRPGAGKSFTMKVTMTVFEYMLEQEGGYEKHIKLTTPSGAAVYQLGFGARTCHSLFYLVIGKIDDPISASKIAELTDSLGPGLKLIVFDEFSMLSVEMFSAAMNRLRESGHKCDSQGVFSDIGFVIIGDPAQILPIGGHYLWSLTLDETSQKRLPIAIQDFRTQMRLTPLSQLPNYEECMDIITGKKQAKDDLTNQNLSRFKLLACKGDYLAVYLDELHRKIEDPTTEQWMTTTWEMRYGQVKSPHLQFILDNMASEADMRKWKHPSILHGIHYFNEMYPGRENVQSDNCKSIAADFLLHNKPLMKFECYSDPPEKHNSLKNVSAKEFRNLQEFSYFCEGINVMLLSNICPPLNLFNGAIHTYVGPLYLNKVYEVKLSKQVLLRSLDGNIFKHPIAVKGSPFHQIPVKSKLLTVDGKDPTTGLALCSVKEVLCRIELPNAPPSLPEYQVIHVDGFEKSGGPNVLGLDFTQDMVPIPLIVAKRCQQGKKTTVPHSRIFHPLELGLAYTGYKAQGATHDCDIIKIKGCFGVPGFLLVCLTRARSIRHIYIALTDFPTVLEIRIQRLNPEVIQAQCSEWMIRIIAARCYRHFCTKPENEYGNLWTDLENQIADTIHDIWCAGLLTKDQCVDLVLQSTQFPQTEVVLVYDRLSETDEFLLQKTPPYVTQKEREELLAFKRNNCSRRPRAQKKRNQAKTESTAPKSKRQKTEDGSEHKKQQVTNDSNHP